MNKNCILFDLDGTISDPKAGITKSFAYALDKFGIETKSLDDYVKFIGPPLRETFSKHYGFEGDDVERAVAAYREYFAEQGIFENTLYPGMKELIAELHGMGRCIVLATSKAELYADKILEHFGISEYFSFVAGSEMDGNRAAKGDIIQYALRNLRGVTKVGTVMVGDREHDVIGAKKNAIDSAGVLYGYGDFNELSAAGATNIFSTVPQLREYLVTGRTS